jgi:asparagine synthase (glutamine-hydrolysing)
LTGDAGDELFAGYNRHLWANRLNNKLLNYPFSIRRLFANLSRQVTPNKYDLIANIIETISGGKLKLNRLGDNVHKLSRVIESNGGFDLYKTLINTGVNRNYLKYKASEINKLSSELFSNESLNVAEQMMLQDTLSYMQHDILTKVDRASMSVSLEARVPFLDNKVFDAAWSIPIEHKIHDGKGKYPLRKIVSKYVPDELMNRPKTGFGMPISSWLRGELREWSESLLSREALEKSEVFDYAEVQSIWQRHLSRKENLQYELWNILMFQQWHGNRK